jgi:hypothetical protein
MVVVVGMDVVIVVVVDWMGHWNASGSYCVANWSAGRVQRLKNKRSGHIGRRRVWRR